MALSLGRTQVRPLSALGAALLSLVPGLLGLAGCEAADEATPLPAAAVDPVRSPLGPGAPSLPPPSRWRLLAVEGERLVTPRWSPSADLLLARGQRGVGLYVLSAVDGGLVYAEEGYRGDAAFTAEGAVCRGPLGGGRRVELDPETRQGVPSREPCEVALRDERLGELLHDGPEGAVYHDAYSGTVTQVAPGGAERVLASRGAWNVAVSPDGRRIAWCLGTLSEPVLLVHDPAAGSTEVGRGAHPAWSPDSRFLAFAAPTVLELPGGGHAYESELFLFDAERRERTRLTSTADIAELQPAFSPDGRSLAFADWEGDVLYVAPLAGRGGADDGSAGGGR